MNIDSLCRRIVAANFAFVLLCGGAIPERAIAAPETDKPRTAHELRVMTFNLRVRTVLDGHNIWDKRRDLVVERVRAFDADLLGTQEGLDSMETYLRQHLSDYTFRGVGRNDGKERGEMCGVFFKTARFEMLDGGFFWLSKTPEKPGSRAWGEVYPRMVTWVKLRPREGGQAFCWFNTHLDAFIPGARARSATLLRSRMEQITGDLPYLVTGDFNTTPDSQPYRTLLAPERAPVATLRDVFRATHPVVTRDEGTFHAFSGHPHGRRIDWILASAQFGIIDAEIDRTRGPGGYSSDHFPMTARLRTSPATAR